MASRDATRRGLDRGRHDPFPRGALAIPRRWRGHATHILHLTEMAFCCQVR